MAVLTPQTVFIKGKYMILVYSEEFISFLAALCFLCVVSIKTVNQGDLFDEGANVKNLQFWTQLFLFLILRLLLLLEKKETPLKQFRLLVAIKIKSQIR